MLRAERRGGVEILTIDRPHAGNAISAGLTTELLEALGRLAEDRGLHAVVVTGAGDRFFCAGGDVKEYRAIATPEELDARFERTRRAMDMLEALPCPVVAAVNGYALGGGGRSCCAATIASPTSGRRSAGRRRGWGSSRPGTGSTGWSATAGRASPRAC